MDGPIKTFLSSFNDSVVKLYDKKVSVEDLLHDIKTNKLILNGYIKHYFDFTKLDNPTWINDLDRVIAKLQNITHNPRTHIKTEKAILETEKVAKFSNSDLVTSLKSDKYWKIGEDGDMYPEKFVSDVYDTNLCIYENRFIVMLINKLVNFVNRHLLRTLTSYKRINNLYNTPIFSYNYSSKIKELNVERKYLSKDKEEIASLLTTDSGSLSQIIEARNSLMILLSSSFYKEVSKSKPLDENSVMPTNILLSDRDYGVCYLFYLSIKQYFDDDYDLDINVLDYRDYVLTNLVNELTNLGYKGVKTNITINDKNHFECSSLIFENNKFSFIIETTPSSIDLTLSYKKAKKFDLNKSKSTISLVLVPYFSSLDDEDVYFDSLVEKNLNKGFDGVFIVTARKDYQTNNNSLLVVSPFMDKIDNNLRNALESLTLLLVGDDYLYKHICPICGGSVSEEDENGNIRCLSCNTVYSSISAEETRKNVKTFWIKKIG